MDRFASWVFPTTRVSEAIRFRPMVLDSFYLREMDPWKKPNATLSEICALYHVDESHFLEEVAGLAVPDAASDWESLPCHYLIDFLTCDHHMFFENDIPAIHHMLRLATEPVRGRTTQNAWMLGPFQEFAGHLRGHLQEEENVLFPAILRNEHLLRHPDGEPTFVAERLLNKEEEFRFTFDYWLNLTPKSQEEAGSSDTVMAVFALVRELEKNIRAHAHLETQRLYPMATRIEKKLHLMAQPV